jgi:murein L,D-transpeptidase YafK
MKCKTATLLLCIIVFGPANVVTASAIDVVRANVFAWARAWESRDIDRYMAFYSPDFRAKDLNFSDWKAKKAYVFQKKDAIQVKIIDPWVLMESNRAVVTFVQQYKDRTVAEVVEKTLVLVNTNHSCTRYGQIADCFGSKSGQGLYYQPNL